MFGQYARNTKYTPLSSGFGKTYSENVHSCRMIMPPISMSLLIDPGLNFNDETRKLVPESTNISQVLFHKGHKNPDMECICESIEDFISRKEDYFRIITKKYNVPVVLDDFPYETAKLGRQKIINNMEKFIRRFENGKDWKIRKVLQAADLQRQHLSSAKEDPFKFIRHCGLQTGCYIQDPQDLEDYLGREEVPISPIV
jgi:hypothetical protein